MIRQLEPAPAPSNLPWQQLLRALAASAPRVPAAREFWMFRALTHKVPFALRQPGV